MHDPDGLLSRLPRRHARRQRCSTRVAGTGPFSRRYDEFVDATGHVRPAWRELAEVDRRARSRRAGPVAQRCPQPRRQRRHHLHPASMTTGRAGSPPTAQHRRRQHRVQGTWHLDAVPLLMSSTDWDTLEAGLVQRSRLLDAVLADLYGPRRAITGGVLPPQLLFGHPGYLRAARGIEVPGRHQLFMHGCDISRAADGIRGQRRLDAGAVGCRLRAGRPPCRRACRPGPLRAHRAAADIAVRPGAAAVADRGRARGRRRSGGGGAQSRASTPRPRSTRPIWRRVLGFPLVESADLVVRDGKLWMRSLGTLKRVDVVLRRVDAAYVRSAGPARRLPVWVWSAWSRRNVAAR